MDNIYNFDYCNKKHGLSSSYFFFFQPSNCLRRVLLLVLCSFLVLLDLLLIPSNCPPCWLNIYLLSSCPMTFNYIVNPIENIYYQLIPTHRVLSFCKYLQIPSTITSFLCFANHPEVLTTRFIYMHPFLLDFVVFIAWCLSPSHISLLRQSYYCALDTSLLCHSILCNPLH